MSSATREKTAANKKAFLQKLEKTLGNVTAACKEIGIRRETYYHWKQKDKAFAKQVEECNESAIDFVESALMKQIQDGNATAIIFFLKTKGRDRGYVEKLQVDQKTELRLEKPMTQEEAKAYLDSIKEKL